jgi:NAD(P)H-binding
MLFLIYHPVAFLLLIGSSIVHGLQSPGGAIGGPSGTTATATTSAAPIPVLVSGASGRTGQLVFSALLNDVKYSPIALLRSPRSAKKLQKAIPATQLDQIFICDVTTLSQSTDQQQQSSLSPPLIPGLERCQSMIICTSAVPIISKLSLLRAFLGIPYNLIRGRKPIDFRSFRFRWQGQQYPELVDYQGQVAQIDFAKKSNIPHVVVVGSMGGTNTSNFLNSVGKTTMKNGTETGNGDILVWKRKAERYLVNSGLDYTIIHPGGLVDTPAGVEEYVLDVNDVLLNNTKRSISREDVANLCVAAVSLYQPGKTRIALDCITRPTAATISEGDDTVATPTTTIRTIPTATEALDDFIKGGKVYDYDL